MSARNVRDAGLVARRDKFPQEFSRVKYDMSKILQFPQAKEMFLPSEMHIK